MNAMRYSHQTACMALVVVICSGWIQSTQAQTSAPETVPVLLQMIRDDSVHRELKLSAGQIEKVVAAVKVVDGPWFRVRIRPANERIAKTNDLTDQLEGTLGSILDTEQLRRLDQLQNQALGTRMVVRNKTAAALGLTKSDRESLYDIFRGTDKDVADAKSKLQSKAIDAKEAARTISKAKSDEKGAFIRELSNDQKRKLSALTGPTFDFSKVMRTYPSAPGLAKEGTQWIGSSGINFDDLKGKVVAVHFYVHHCINCKRNLPHYSKWHTDYADDGLVVIGIQTPEDFPGRQDKSGRNTDVIAASMKQYDIQYPVVLDSDLAIWNQWSNTMWPTVYLVDKKGFIRRWWQGEMNWEGTPGEQQMRETIEQLLAEDG